MKSKVQLCWPETRHKNWMATGYIKGLSTIIITSYQRAEYIEKTVNSIYFQTYRPIELIVIDDGSYDNTRIILEEWEKKIEKRDFYFMYVYQDNSGAPSARNLALSLSKGEFIQEVGSDDLLHHRKLELSIGELQKNLDCQSVWCPLQRFHDFEEFKIIKQFTSIELQNNIEVASITTNLFVPQFLPSAALHRREVFYHAGPWNEKFKRWQDLEYQTRIAYCINKYIKINHPLYFYRQHNGLRINSQYESKNGIDAGLLVLETIENNLNVLNFNNKEMGHEISKHYFSIAQLAASFSLKTDIIIAIEGSVRNRNDIIFLTKTSLLLFLSTLIGYKSAFSIVKKILKFKLAFTRVK